MTVQTYIQGTTAVNIAYSVENAVARGLLAPGASLPTVRELATHLGVSNATVASAYQTLRTRGVVMTEGRRGTRVRHAPPLSARPHFDFDDGVIDLAAGNPDPALLPSLRGVLRRVEEKPRLYVEEPNLPRLVELGQKQFRADGIAAHSMAIVSGALDGMERVLREHLRAGDRVAVEDPCFTGISDLLSSLSLLPVPVRIDDEGLLPAELQDALRGGCQALILTPRAQNPTGAALSAARVRKLRPILRLHPDLLVIEDDHAGPVAGVALHSVIERDRRRWAVVRSVSKSLGPDLRVAFLAGDEMTISRVTGRQTLGIRWVSHVLQELVAELYDDPDVIRLLERARNEYALRRQALLEALEELSIEAHGVSGLNVWIPVSEEATVISALHSAGYGVVTGERYRLRSGAAIRVTTARLTPLVARRFAATLEQILRPRRRVTA